MQVIKRVDCTIFSSDVLHSHRLPGNNQRDREHQMLLKSLNSHMELIPVWAQFATDQFDPWQVVPKQVFTPYSRLLMHSHRIPGDNQRDREQQTLLKSLTVIWSKYLSGHSLPLISMIRPGGLGIIMGKKVVESE